MSSLEHAEWAIRGALWLAVELDLQEHADGLTWALRIVEAEKAGRL